MELTRIIHIYCSDFALDTSLLTPNPFRTRPERKRDLFSVLKLDKNSIESASVDSLNHDLTSIKIRNTAIFLSNLKRLYR